MKHRFLFLIFFIFFLAICFGQDIIIKKDSTKISVNVTEINPYEIKYNRYDNPNGPIYVIDKNEVASIIYQNGVSEVFKKSEPVKPVTIGVATINTSSPKDSTKHQIKLSDYIKFNIQAGVVINNSYCNLIRHGETSGHITSTNYSSNNKNDYNTNLNVGFNFLFGRSPYVKHVIGINYLRSKGEFNYNYSQGGYTSYKVDFRYISKIDFINFTTGLRFKIGKHLYIEPLISFNCIAKADVKYTGTITTTTISGGPTPQVTASETEYFNNKNAEAEDKKVENTISLCPKILYDFNIKQHKLGAYLSYNLSFGFRLPWYMLGITYYPFKKLR